MGWEDMITPDLRATLERAGPGFETLRNLRDAMRRGALSAEINRITAPVSPPAPGQVLELPPAGPEREALRARGEAALRAGQVGIVVLNGGMATRFGGVVKGVVPVDGDASFLALKVRDATRAAARAGGPPPIVIIMNSRATASATATHLATHDFFGHPADRIWQFEQQWSLRLTPDGDVFCEDGEPSCYGPGHGDLGPCLRSSGLLDRFSATGGRVLLMSNVDNVVATLDPVLIGLHLEQGAAITVEVVDKWAGDAGGAPAVVDDKLQIVEGFRFPVDFDQARIPVFNTNTLFFDVEALRAEVPLTWFRVDKKVDGAPVVQFERLVGELTAHLPSAFVRVPREGIDTRFVPIKSPEDLERTRAQLLDVWNRRG